MRHVRLPGAPPEAAAPVPSSVESDYINRVSYSLPVLNFDNETCLPPASPYSSQNGHKKTSGIIPDKLRPVCEREGEGGGK